MDAHAERAAQPADRQARILDATLKLLARHGISGVSVRAVAREAEVALGLVNYHYADKTSLIRAVLHRIEEQDVALLAVDASHPPEKQVRLVLRRIAEPRFLAQEYLSLRLQLWALAQAHEDFADINTTAQKKYRSGLAALIRAARPTITRGESNRRAADIDVLQNGLWLTALLGLDQASIRRCVKRCEEIAFADH